MFRHIDVDESRELALQHDVNFLPHTIITVDGKTTDRFNGVVAYETLKKAIEAALMQNVSGDNTHKE